MVDGLRIAIAGGSVGGLTAACLLREAGHDVTIFERSSRELEQRGAGIGFLEAAARYLVSRAGVDIDAISITTPFIRYLGRRNNVLHEQTHRYRFSSWNTVYRNLLTAHGPTGYQLGAELCDWDTDAGGVTVRFTDGSECHADLLLCADGVGSTSRARLLPACKANYAGYVAWRGMVPEASLPDALSARLTEAITYNVSANSHILVYPIPALDGSVKPGERLINFVWYRNYLDGDELADLLTDADGELRDLSVPPGKMAPHHVAEARAYAAARLPKDIATVVCSASDPFIQVVYDIEVERMVFGRVCLLGDAAFVARPHAAAGTAKAAEDGWQLACALAGAESLEAGLRTWEARQLELGHDLVRRARAIGERSQTLNSWVAGDPELLFGLYRAGDAGA
ncbi:MAG: FAD-dependent monooxygenase [Pseudomonadota bacterium]